VELVKELKAQKVCVCSVEQTAETVLLQDISTLEGDKFALIFGNEVNGVDQEAIDLSNYVVEVPQFGTKHSLNVSVCAGVVLWEFIRKSITA
jgi:23S rRNA (guanosine2251-2'-O)-methyltransferase